VTVSKLKPSKGSENFKKAALDVNKAKLSLSCCSISLESDLISSPNNTSSDKETSV
jgi:hypothetical protein